MATTNVTVSGDWVKVAEAGDNPALVQLIDAFCEVAATATDAAPAPALRGHQLNTGEAISRMVIGGGYLWARSRYDRPAFLVVSK